MKQQLLDRFAAEKEKLPPDTRVMVLTYFPRYQIFLFIVLNWVGSYISLLEAQGICLYWTMQVKVVADNLTLLSEEGAKSS